MRGGRAGEWAKVGVRVQSVWGRVKFWSIGCGQHLQVFLRSIPLICRPMQLSSSLCPKTYHAMPSVLCRLLLRGTDCPGSSLCLSFSLHQCLPFLCPCLVFSVLFTKVRLNGNNPEATHGVGVWSESCYLLRLSHQVSLDMCPVLSRHQLFICKTRMFK